MDADDAATWPTPFADFIGELVGEARRCMNEDSREFDYTDLGLLRYEAHARQLLRGHLVRARHFTRLLDHEADAIRAQGLRLLDIDLVHDRLDQAYERGLLTQAECSMLRTENCLTPNPATWGRRVSQVCLVLSTSVMTHHVEGVEYLLSYWGGEAIYWRYCDTDPQLSRKLRSLGKPAVVTALVDLSDPQAHSLFSPLVQTFVGKGLGNHEANSDVFYRSPIPPEHIEAIIHPGDPAYDRFPDLPRD